MSRENGVLSSSRAAREKVLQEIKISLQPFANNDIQRPMSSASSTSDSSSSPGQTSGIGSSVSSTYSSLPSNGLIVDNSGLSRQILQLVISNGSSELPSPSSSSISSASSLVSRPSFQAWPARQAISQSPVIMQSVKSTHVKKPVLQTAIAPTSPPITSLPLQRPSLMANSLTCYPASSSSSSIIRQQPQPDINVPPYVTSNGQKAHTQTGSVSQTTTGTAFVSSQLQECYPANPPPSYALAMQQQQQHQQTHVQSTASALHPTQHTIHHTTHTQHTLQTQHSQQTPHSQHTHQREQQSCYQPQYQQTNSCSLPSPPPIKLPNVPQNLNHPPLAPQHLSQPPPPPPPPPYSASVAITQPEPQLISVMWPMSPYCNDLNGSVVVPTTDPPSYASSVAALAAQRAAVANSAQQSLSNSSVYNSSSSVSSVSVQSQRNSRMTSNLPYNIQLPTRPAPMPPSNCDLVNTVESICTSQVSALQGVPSSVMNGRFHQMEMVPPLPPKPSQMNSDVTSIASSSATDSESSVSTNSASTSSARQRHKSYKTTHQSPIPPRKNLSIEREKERRETKVKIYSPAAFKFFMEQHVENVIKSHQQRERRRQQLESEMAKVGLSEEAQCQMRRMLHQKESNYIRLRRAKMDRSMFTKIRTIGVGAFGEVALVRKVDANQLYAMKTLRKSDVLKRNQVAHVKAERDILAEADNEWVVKLYYSFQDKDHLYFVMDYIPGGDLMSLLIKFGIFEERLARFYIAELVLAVESVHKMGFIHRDIKPDNVLIDSDGHIKLTDFGLCTGFRWTHNSKYYQRSNNNIDGHDRQDSMDIDESWSNNCHCHVNISKPLERRRRREHQRCLAHSLVGTPNYIAPEVLMRTGYTQLCDWWSVGVILYEMLVGQPPFFANTPEETQNKVIHWDKTLRIPKEAELSTQAHDLILKLCCGPEERIGKNGANEIKKHPFFAGIDFDGGVRKQPAPYIPEIKHPTDTSNFDAIDDSFRSSDSNGSNGVMSHDSYSDGAFFEATNGHYSGNGTENGKHPEHAFFEFTFRRFFDAGGQAYPIKLSDNNSTNSNNSGSNDSGQGSPVYV